MSKVNPNDLITEYLVAYEAGNGKPFRGSMTYQNGWFVVRDLIPSLSFLLSQKFRRTQIENMRDRLLERAHERGSKNG